MGGQAALDATEEANAELVGAFIRTWGKDFDPAQEYARYFAPDCRLRIESPSDSAVQFDKDEVHVGYGAAVASAQKYLDAGLIYEANIHDVYASGPVVVTRRDDMLKRPGHPDKPVKAVGVFILRDGKIVEWADYMG